MELRMERIVFQITPQWFLLHLHVVGMRLIGKMKKGQVVLGLFVPADEQATKAVHPRMRSFHHPTARFEPGLLFDGSGFFSSWADMGSKAEFAQDVAYLVVVIALV